MSRSYNLHISETYPATRTDNITGQTENFNYDNLDRLTKIFTPIQNTTYAGNGNINSKTSGGGYKYDATRVHAVREVAKDSLANKQQLQKIDYTKFGKAMLITQQATVIPAQTQTYALTYGPDEQRVNTIYTDTTGNKIIRYYAGAYEKDSAITSGGVSTIKKIHYISGGTGLAAIFIKWSTGVDSMFYVCTDRQGSITALLKQDGTISEKFSYDAWGRRRNPANWADYNVPAPRLINRGYTGHEMLDGFGLINMNGRMYDPVIGRVLSPDNYVQDPTNTQSYNRYSYCLNNPLRYTDPSGWLTLAAFNNAVDIANNRYARSGVYSWGPGTDDQGFYSSSDGDVYATGAAYNDCYNSWGNTLYPTGANVVKHNPNKINTGMTWWARTSDGTLWKNRSDAVWYSLEARQKPLTESLQDPDLMKLQSEQDGFLRIWESSFFYKSEFGCLITTRGLITFQVGKSEGDGFGGLEPIWKGNKCYVKYEGSNYRVLGAAHVHWDKDLDACPSQTQDYRTAFYTLKKQVPIFVLAYDKEIYMVNYTNIDYSEYLNKYKVESLLNGNLSLIKMLKIGLTQAK